MSPRRGNQESWISSGPNARGYFEAFVWMGTKPNGKPDRRHVQRRTLAAVRRAVRELERQRGDGTAGRPGRPPTVEELLERRFTVVLPARGRAPRTLDDYRSKARNDIYPRWGGLRADRLTPEMLEDGYAEMLAAGHAPGHVRKVHAILSSAFGDEVRRGNLARNPCGPVRPPELEQREMPSLSLPQARKVLSAITGRPNAARWAVGLACGLRQGEALGLRWQYVDLDAAELRVWYQLQRLTWRHGCTVASSAAGATGDLSQRSSTPGGAYPCGGKRGADCPQRASGGLVFRDIKERRRKAVPLAAEVVTLLRSHRAEQAAARLAAGPEWEDHGLVFCQPNGKPVDPRADWEDWRVILEEAGIPHIGVHGGRHTTATVGLEQRVGLAVIQEILGHSDPRITRGYTHVSSPLAHEGAAAVGRALFAPDS